MADSDDGFAALANGLNEDSKASRRRKPAAQVETPPAVNPEADADLAGEGPDPVKPDPAAEPETEERDPLDLSGINTDALEAAAERAEVIAASLVGDIRDTMMEVFKHRPKAWSQMLAGEQKDVATALEYAAKVIVNKAVLALAAEDRPSIKAVFKGYADKAGELTGTVKFVDVQDADVLALHRASGKTILLVVADSQAFSGQRREADVDADQKDMEFEADKDDDDADLNEPE
jgi:hypothetical protein